MVVCTVAMRAGGEAQRSLTVDDAAQLGQLDDLPVQESAHREVLCQAALREPEDVSRELRGRQRTARAHRHVLSTIASLALFGALLSAATLTAPAVASELPVAPPQRVENPGVGEIIVAFRADVSREDRASLRAGADVSRVRSLRLRDTELVKAPEGRSAAALRALSRSPRVRYAEPNGVVRAQSADTYWTLLWGLQNTGQKVNGVTGTADADIGAPEAWTQSSGAGQTVAVVDSGVTFDHRDLQGQSATNPGESGAGRESNGIDDDRNGLVDDYRGWDFVDGDNLPGDLNGHGTHVAGTIAALKDNNLGVVGVAPSAKVMSLRALDATGSGTNAAVSDAFALAGDLGIAVVNASLGGGYSRAVQDAIAAHPDTLYAVAAGNGGADGIGDDNDLTPTYPCALPEANVVCVGATDSADQRAAFSNSGRRSVDLFAPGVSIASTWIDNPANGCTSSCYVYSSGTSMAAPHVAAALALMRAANPTLTSTALKTLLLDGVDPKPTLTTAAVSGGRLNSQKAVGAAAALMAGTVDTAAPQTTIDSGPSGTIRTGAVSFGFSSSEAGSSFECRLDALGATIASYGPCPSPKAYSSLPDGQHTFSVRATDTAGNTDTTPATRAFTADTTAPQTTIDTGPSGTISTGAVSFSFSSEANASFECQLDAGAWATCSPPQSYSSLPDGQHTFSVRATDTAGNTDTTPATRAFTVATPTTSTVPPISAPATPSATTTPSTSTQNSTAKAIVPNSPTRVASAVPLRAPMLTIPASARKITAGATGIATLKLTAPTLDGTGALTLTRAQKSLASGARPLPRLGSKRFAFSASKKLTVRVQLSPASRRLLKRMRTIRVRATIRATGATGITATRTVTLTLTRRLERVPSSSRRPRAVHAGLPSARDAKMEPTAAFVGRFSVRVG